MTVRRGLLVASRLVAGVCAESASSSCRRALPAALLGLEPCSRSLWSAIESSKSAALGDSEGRESHRTASTSARSFFTSAPMPSKVFKQRRLLGWSPEQMYTVVSKVEDYHKFVPWCQKSRIVKPRVNNYMEAELEVGFQVLVERYTSQVFLTPPHTVRSRVADSALFDHLDSTWTMEPGPTPQSCWLSFHVDFAFRSQLHGYLADLFFAEVVKQMTGAFEGRCGVLYGPSSLLAQPPRPRQQQQQQHSHQHQVHKLGHHQHHHAQQPHKHVEPAQPPAGQAVEGRAPGGPQGRGAGSGSAALRPGGEVAPSGRAQSSAHGGAARDQGLAGVEPHR